MTSPLPQSRNPYLFVVGCPRSGTTLLQRMLDAHPQLAVANDTHFIPRAIRKARSDFVASGPAGEQIRLTPELIDQVRSYHRFPRLGLAESTVGKASLASSTYRGFVGRLYLEFARLSGKSLGGEKTPDYVRHLPLLHALFPWVRSVHIIRDGRDVALSALEWAREGKGPGRMALWREEPVAVCALWWRWQVRTGRQDAESLRPGSYLEVRYENLVEGPEETLRSITDFLQLPFAREEMLGFNKGKVRHEKGLSVKKAWRDWRQLEFPATTNGIPRFFRADPDHEGMVKDQQVRRLVKLKKNEKTLTMAAAKAGMSRKTARKYLKSGKLPSQCQPERYWRTRSDPFESVWPEVKEILKRSPTVEAKAVFDHLCRQQEGAFQQGQLRTLQRRIKQWKAEYGEAKEVMFPQKYQPGHQAQSDFTFMGRLGVTIQGQPFPHLLYHFVLAYSNWEAATLCFSESFESLSLGLQNALWELGALPEEHRTDRLSAAVKNLKREEFTERYQALLRHFGMRSSRTQAGKAHENGDVEQSHHRLKRAIEQELLLRCSRDFSSREEYEGFVAVIVSRRNAARQKRLGEELAVMRPLPARRLDDFTRQWVRVSPSSTRVRHNTYSVDSRLIGERVQVRVWADQVEVYYGGRRQARMPRLRGEGKHRIDYRHVIHSLVRKPGAFTRYRWREDLFPGILFRVAYDELRRDCPATADRQYLKILEVAAQEGEQRVREALQVLIERGQRIRFEALRECLVDPVVEPWEVMVEKMDVGLYDTLLENREVRS